MKDEYIASFVKSMMEDEVSKTLEIPQGINLPLYYEALLERFRNPDLNHALSQIAMDGSQKLPQRILAPIQELLEGGESITILSQVVSAWLLFIGSQDNIGYKFPLHDPLAAEIRQRIENCEPNASGLHLDLLQYQDIFSSTISNSKAFRNAVVLGGIPLHSFGTNVDTRTHL